MAGEESTVKIFNQALARLGGEQLSSVESPWKDSALGILCHNNYTLVLDTALSAHDWAFALKRQTLARVEDQNPHPEYQYRYKLPSECLRPRCLTIPGARGQHHYIIEGENLLANVAPAALSFVSRVTDPALFPPAFTTALAWGLAGVLATARINDPQRQQLCQQNYELYLAEAIARDQNAINPRPAGSAWLDARAGR